MRVLLLLTLSLANESYWEYLDTIISLERVNYIYLGHLIVYSNILTIIWFLTNNA